MADNFKLQNFACTTSISMLTVTFLLLLLSASGQPGFLSLDCGANKNYTDSNITWVTDDNYIHGLGRTAQLTNGNFATYPSYLRNVRYFPQPLTKSCYELPVIPNVPHLLRVLFLFGNYSRIQKLPISFDFTYETEGMLFKAENMTFTDPKQLQQGEDILISLGNVLYICLIRTSSDDDPFISSIELRRLKQGMYNQTVKPGTMLHLVQRYDTGAEDRTKVRYPQDPFDRIWSSDISWPTWNGYNVSREALSEELMMTYRDRTQELPPTAVMRTAMVAGTNMDTIQFSLDVTGDNVKYLILLYFAEIETLTTSESRIFNISMNGHTKYPHFTPFKQTEIERSIVSDINPSNLEIDLVKMPGSSRSPIINALEQYMVIDTEPETSAEDVGALYDVRRTFRLKDWISDPCFVSPWKGIKCTKNPRVRIFEINLAGRNISGSMPPSIGRLTALINLYLDSNHLRGELPDLSNLTKLQKLHLQNNNLSGPLPEWLSTLKNLKELFIDNNSFSGVIPQKLWENHSLNLLNLSYTGNHNLSAPNSKNNKVKVVVGSTIGGFFAIALLLVISMVVYRKKFRTKQNVDRHTSDSKSRENEAKSLEKKDFTLVEVPNPTKSRAFTLEEMMAATQNFSQKIGQGGFGSVFFGKLANGKNVAVKVLSLFSKQGAAEFLNEVDLLSRIHHKNLVSLLGYCNESRELMLVYEHMSGGSLKDHLYGPTAGLSNLDWKRRLKIALDAAQGLEYLHVGCTPKIIHRDVKTANILLDGNLTGKLSDFGLSRMTIDDGSSHVTTTVKGTVGYMDPEYFLTHLLTEKTDIYSFGVVLLEIICGRQPINSKLSEDQLNLVRWATPYVETDGDPSKLAEIIDKRLQHNEYDMKSLSHVAKLAIRCVQSEPSIRPTVSDIVAEIKEAIKFQADSAPAVVSEELDIEYDESQASPVCTSMNSSAPKELGSTDSSYNTIEEGRKLRILL